MNKSRIVWYDELDDLSQLTSLYHLSLNWSVTPELFEKKRQNDDRYVPEFGLFSATSDDMIVGAVFLMEILTRTLKGKLLVGGINAVATRPGYQRRGVMTALMTRCHEYFHERRLEYCFLTTSQTLGAYTMYKKLGYNDLAIREIAWKQAETPTLPDKTLAVTDFQKEDNSEVARIFREATKGSYGFVYRPENFLEARIDGPFTKPEPTKNMRLAKLNDRVDGYIYWEPSPQLGICTEILALDKSSFLSLLANAKKTFLNKALVIHCQGLTKREKKWLQSAHYRTGIPTYGTVMIKSLRSQTALRSMRTLFGVDQDLFRMGVWDST